jgi:flagellar biogenesis protein FliO
MSTDARPKRIIFARAESLPALASWRRLLAILWRRTFQIGRRVPRRLRLCESLSLGDRRFLAVIECEDSRFLVGGTSSSLALLARLDDGEESSSHPSLSREEDASC